MGKQTDQDARELFDQMDKTTVDSKIQHLNILIKKHLLVKENQFVLSVVQAFKVHLD